MNNTEMMRMFIPKSRFKYRLKKNRVYTIADAQANTDWRIEQNKQSLREYLAKKAMKATP